VLDEAAPVQPTEGVLVVREAEELDGLVEGGGLERMRIADEDGDRGRRGGDRVRTARKLLDVDAGVGGRDWHEVLLCYCAETVTDAAVGPVTSEPPRRLTVPGDGGSSWPPDGASTVISVANSLSRSPGSMPTTCFDQVAVSVNVSGFEASSATEISTVVLADSASVDLGVTLKAVPPWPSEIAPAAGGPPVSA